MTPTFSIITSSVASREDGEAIARVLVGRKLAGCVHIMPITSVYRWEGAVHAAPEHMLVCKIRQDDFDAVDAMIRALHGYAVPEIVAVPVTGVSGSYGAWLEAATERGPP